MKKIIIIIVLVINQLLNAQVVFEVSTVGVYPVGQNQSFNYGAGFNIKAGYLVKNNLEITADIEKVWLSGFAVKHTLSSFSGGIRYYPFKQSLLFVGLGLGLYQSYLKLPDFEGQEMHFYENSFGISPKIGVLFECGIIDNLYIPLQLSYNKVFTTNSFSFVSITAGLRYVLE